jgi:hypothetical protein
MIKKIFFLLLLALVVIQFIRPAENHSDKLSKNDITVHYTVPDTVLSILRRSCYDCHSNNTHYPWYNKIQPVAWWLNSHVREGMRKLNFSEFASYPLAKQAKKLKGTVKLVKEGSMPLDSYLWIHKDADLTDGQRDTVIQWANNLQQTILKAGPGLTDKN